MIAVPALWHRFGRLDPILAFWWAYVLTRPLGASLADWLGKPTSGGGLGVGAGVTSAVLAAMIVAVVIYLQRTGADAPQE